MRAPTIYQADLAYVHHAGFSALVRQAAPALRRLLRRAGLKCGTLIDLGCGSGIWARQAQRAGFDVIGVDCSSAMVRLAKRVAPGARFFCASLHHFRFPPCDVVTALGEGFNYLPPGRGRAPGLRRLFGRIAKALRPGGMLIFDLIVSDGSPMNYRTWRSGKDWAVLVEVSEPRRRRLLVRKITTFRKVRAGYRRSEEVHAVRLFERAEVARALRQAGFSFRVARGYGRRRLPPRRLAFIARKPA